MNQTTLNIIVHDKVTVLERILQVTRYRGFFVVALNSSIKPESALIDIKLVVRSELTIDRLLNQINKLIDIVDVTIVKEEVLGTVV